MRKVLWFGVVAVFALSSVSPVRAEEAPKKPDVEKKLVGNWPLREGEGLAAKDTGGNGRDGKILNDGRGVKWVDGRSGKAAEFAGGDPAQRDKAGCIEIPNMADVDFGKGMTVQAWVKFTELKRDATYEIVSNTQSDRGKGWRFRVSWLQLDLMSGDGEQAWSAAFSGAATKLETGVWYHLAGTYDGSVFRVYMDGKEAGVSKEGLTLTQGKPSVCIGSYCGGYAYGLNAVVSDVKIYNYARSAADILTDAKLAE